MIYTFFIDSLSNGSHLTHFLLMFPCRAMIQLNREEETSVPPLLLPFPTPIFRTVSTPVRYPLPSLFLSFFSLARASLPKFQGQKVRIRSVSFLFFDPFFHPSFLFFLLHLSLAFFSYDNLLIFKLSKSGKPKSALKSSSSFFYLPSVDFLN